MNQYTVKMIIYQFDCHSPVKECVKYLFRDRDCCLGAGSPVLRDHSDRNVRLRGLRESAEPGMRSRHAVLLIFRGASLPGNRVPVS